ETATGAASYTQNTALTDGTSDDGYVTWKNLLWHSGSSSYGVVTNKTAGSESVITVYVAGASVVTWTGSTYSNGTVTVTDANGNTIVNAVSTKTATDKTSEGFIYTGTEATTLTLKFSAASTYINNLVVSALDDETDSVSAVTVTGSSTVVVDETVELSATVTAAYLSTDTSVTWSSSDTSIATVDSDGVVTGIAAGTVTITATSVATSSVYGEKSVKVSADANSPIYGYTYSYTLTGGVGTPYSSDDGFLTVTANSDNGSHGLVMKDGNTIVLKVAGAGTISLLRCQYDKSATITLTNSEGSVIETKEALAATDACGDATDFTYSGEADTLTFTYSAGTGGHYLHGVKFTPSETTTTYTLTGGVGTPYSSDDGLLTVTANSDNGSHGLVMKDGNTIVLKVAGAGTISLLRCQYDKSATITLTNSEGTVIETKEALAATSACGDATDFTYSGEADTLTFTYSAGTGGHYLHGVTVAY
ncbi:Ig domain-containing protein, partial [Treponema sp.]|uniref:Ig-like domain-containing protein n=1 Tax=Treponema sp. TaxID=166 RepID=UPI00388E25FC